MHDWPEAGDGTKGRLSLPCPGSCVPFEAPDGLYHFLLALPLDYSSALPTHRRSGWTFELYGSPPVVIAHELLCVNCLLFLCLGFSIKLHILSYTERTSSL